MTEEMEKELQEQEDLLTLQEVKEEEKTTEAENPYLEFGICESDFH